MSNMTSSHHICRKGVASAVSRRHPSFLFVGHPGTVIAGLLRLFDNCAAAPSIGADIHDQSLSILPDFRTCTFPHRLAAVGAANLFHLHLPLFLRLCSRHCPRSGPGRSTHRTVHGRLRRSSRSCGMDFWDPFGFLCTPGRRSRPFQDIPDSVSYGCSPFCFVFILRYFHRPGALPQPLNPRQIG